MILIMFIEKENLRKKELQAISYETLIKVFYRYVKFMLVNTELKLPEGLKHPMPFIDKCNTGEIDVDKARELNHSYRDCIFNHAKAYAESYAYIGYYISTNDQPKLSQKEFMDLNPELVAEQEHLKLTVRKLTEDERLSIFIAMCVTAIPSTKEGIVHQVETLYDYKITPFKFMFNFENT